MSAKTKGIEAELSHYFEGPHAATDDVRLLERFVARGGKCRSRDADPEDWYPLSGESLTASEETRKIAAAQARTACAGCPVIGACLELALQIPAGRHGVWGGTTALERRALLGLPTHISAVDELDDVDQELAAEAVAC